MSQLVHKKRKIRFVYGACRHASGVIGPLKGSGCVNIEATWIFPDALEYLVPGACRLHSFARELCNVYKLKEIYIFLEIQQLNSNSKEIPVSRSSQFKWI